MFPKFCLLIFKYNDVLLLCVGTLCLLFFILEVCPYTCGQQMLPKTSRLKHILFHVAQNLGFYQAAVQCMIVL